jgi:hypothetical protein
MHLKRLISYILVAAFLTVCGLPQQVSAGQNAKNIEFLLSQVRQASGPLTGGKVYAYASGTDTPKTIWLDRNKVTAAANPYTLDANGTAQLFGDGLYRIVIKTSAGVTVYDRSGLSYKDALGLAYDVADYASLAAACTALNGTGATLQYGTDQTLTANLVVDVELVPMNGATINHGVYTVAPPSGKWIKTERWPLAQIFNGTGAVTGLQKSNPLWFGAQPSAYYGEINAPRATANTLAFQKSINALHVEWGTEWTLPAGIWETNGTVTFPYWYGVSVVFRGVIVNDFHGADAIVFNEGDHVTVRGLDVRRTAISGATWDDAAVVVKGGYNRSNFQVGAVGFKYGLKIESIVGTRGTGMAWNQFYFTEVKDNLYGIHISVDGGGGYFNQNGFYHGLVKLQALYAYDQANGKLSHGFYFGDSGAWIYNNNHFHLVDVSNYATGMRLTAAYNFKLDNMRFEGVDTYINGISGAALDIKAATALDLSKFSFSTQFRGITFSGASDYTNPPYRNIVMDNIYGGITFTDVRGMDQTLSSLATDYTNRAGLYYDNYQNDVQNFDKQFTGATAPTTGTYKKNAVQWNTNVTAGQVMGWVASRGGTMGTLNAGATTGGITIGTPTLVVNDATGLLIGQEVAVAGAIVQATITNIVGTTITLSSNATATVAGAAVSFFAALWKTMAAYP